jgi:hypothetical protein
LTGKTIIRRDPQKRKEEFDLGVQPAEIASRVARRGDAPWMNLLSRNCIRG